MSVLKFCLLNSWPPKLSPLLSLFSPLCNYHLFHLFFSSTWIHSACLILLHCLSNGLFCPLKKPSHSLLISIMYFCLFLPPPKYPLHPSLLLLAFVFSKFCPLQCNSCLMNGELMPVVWTAQLTTADHWVNRNACLFALGLKPANKPHTRSIYITLEQTWARVQVTPQEGEPSGPLVNISTKGDGPRATFSKASVVKTTEYFPLGGRPNPDPEWNIHRETANQLREYRVSYKPAQ